MNIQTLPRKDTIIKRAFLPKLDALVFADYSAIEYRLYAYYMSVVVGDETAADVFRDGGDIHAEQAIRIYNALDWSYTLPLEDGVRQVGKTSNFAALYSGGIPTIQRQLGCDKDTARRIADAFHTDNPGLGRWEWVGRGFRDPEPWTLNGQLCSVLSQRGYITTLWGRHLHPEEDRKALNALIQGGAADLMKQSMVNIHRNLKEEGLRSHMVVSIHDEIGLDCPDYEVDFIIEALPAWMDDPTVSEVVPIEVDIKQTQTSWADAKEV